MADGADRNNFNDKKEVISLSHVSNERWRLKCCVCEKVHGAPLQCSEDGCCTAYHLLCARRAGFEIQMYDDKTNKYKWLSFCEEHTRKRRRLRDQRRRLCKGDPMTKYVKGDPMTKYGKGDPMTKYVKGAPMTKYLKGALMTKYVKNVVRALKKKRRRLGPQEAFSQIMKMRL